MTEKGRAWRFTLPLLICLLVLVDLFLLRLSWVKETELAQKTQTLDQLTRLRAEIDKEEIIEATIAIQRAVTSPPLPAIRKAVGGGSRALTGEESRYEKLYNTIHESKEYKDLQTSLDFEKLQMKYGLFERLGKLTADEREKFLTICDRIEHLDSDIGDALRHEPLDVNQRLNSKQSAADMIRVLRQQALAEIDTQLSSVLGTDRAAMFNSYRGNIAAYGLVAEFTQSLSANYLDISDQQLQQLAKIVDEQLRDSKSSLTPFATAVPNTDRSQILIGSFGVRLVSPREPAFLLGGIVKSGIEISAATLESAATFLSPAQLAQLKEVSRTQEIAKDLGAQIRF